MYFVSVTRLRLRSLWRLRPFLKANEASARELASTTGFICGKELVDKGLVFWTISLWHADADMKTFRNSEPHRKAMQNLPTWCDEATYVHWTQEQTELPSWQVAYERMKSDGKTSKVRNASKRHEAMDFPPPKWLRMERIFKTSGA